MARARTRTGVNNTQLIAVVPRHVHILMAKSPKHQHSSGHPSLLLSSGLRVAVTSPRSKVRHTKAGKKVVLSTDETPAPVSGAASCHRHVNETPNPVIVLDTLVPTNEGQFYAYCIEENLSCSSWKPWCLAVFCRATNRRGVIPFPVH